LKGKREGTKAGIFILKNTKNKIQTFQAKSSGQNSQNEIKTAYVKVLINF